MDSTAAYQLIIGSDLSLTIESTDKTSKRTNEPLCHWPRRVVRYLFETNALPRRYHRIGAYPFDKCEVWHLILAVAAAHTLLRESKPQPKRTRTQRVSPLRSFGLEPVRIL